MLFDCVYTCSPLLLYFFWFVASHPYYILPYPWPHYIHKRPFDLNMHMFLSVDIRGLPSLFVACFLECIELILIYLKHLRETLIVCICEALLLLIHLLNWLIVFHVLNCLDDSVSICFHWLCVGFCLCLSLSRFCENCAALFLFCESL